MGNCPHPARAHRSWPGHTPDRGRGGTCVRPRSVVYERPLSSHQVSSFRLPGQEADTGRSLQVHIPQRKHTVSYKLGSTAKHNSGRGREGVPSADRAHSILAPRKVAKHIVADCLQWRSNNVEIARQGPGMSRHQHWEVHSCEPLLHEIQGASSSARFGPSGDNRSSGALFACSCKPFLAANSLP